MDYVDATVHLKNFLDEDKRITQLPKKRQLQVYVLFYIASKIEGGKTYEENEINDIISRWHTFNDTALLRRYLYQTGFLERHKNGSEYWVKEPQPTLDEFQAWVDGRIG